MSKRKPTPPRRSLRPTAESLETRELLSLLDVPKGVPTQAATAVVRGTDPDGAQWTLRLYGPGALSVVGTNGDVFSRSTGDLQESIDTITVGGRDHYRDPLVGTVNPNPAGERERLLPEPDRDADRRAGQDRHRPGEQFPDRSERHSRHRHARFLSGSHRDDQAERAVADPHAARCRPARSTSRRA